MIHAGHHVIVLELCYQHSSMCELESSPAGRAATHHHYRWLDDGVRPRIGLLGYSRAHLGCWVSCGGHKEMVHVWFKDR